MIDQDSALDAYKHAQKLAKGAYMSRVSQGRNGYLPSLDGLIRNTEIASEVNIGTVEVPISKIKGTLSHSRASAFAHNFMPLPPADSEFGHKWQNLYAAHIREGIRDSVVAYEYLNWFYIKEGNKRTSILKYADAVSITAEVRRLIPRRDEDDLINNLYFEFLEFYRETGICSVWFTIEGSFRRFLDYMNRYDAVKLFNVTKYQSFMANIYYPFRSIYHASGGAKIDITTGDALLRFLEIYFPMQTITEAQHRESIVKLCDELKNSSTPEQSIVTEPVNEAKRVFFSSKKDLIHAAFVYAKTINTSGWTYAHELGRLHVANVFGENIKSTFVENVPETNDAYDVIKKLAEDGNEVIFTTSPTFVNPTLKAAFEFPKTKFFNCSEANSFKNVVTFFGRIHEPKYLMGIIAGAVTRSNSIGYIATHPIPEIIENINAFALGVKLVNPHARVRVEWVGKQEYCATDQSLINVLHDAGVDIINQDSLPLPGDRGKAYGLFQAQYDEKTGTMAPKIQYAIPIWHWGIFYEKVTRSILTGTWAAAFESAGASQKPVNFWWGMDSGLVDIFYSLTHVPRETQRLIDFIKKMIIQNEYSVFSGPIYDREGNLRVAEEQTASFEQIFSMDWLVDNVDGAIPVQMIGENI